MRPTLTWLAPLVLVAALGRPAAAADAAALFAEGAFDAAAEAWAGALAASPDDHAALTGLGRVALLANRLDEAVDRFRQALALRPDDADAKIMLAEALYRQDDLPGAIAALDGVDAGNPLIVNQYPTLDVATLKAFAGQTPYVIDGEGESTRLPFVRSEPLPLVTVRVNGGEEVTFFIDTGASVVTLDSDFARELGVDVLGTVKGTFSGGETTAVTQGRIDSITVGDWTVRNLPVAMLPLRPLSEGLGARRIDGILGTTLFSRFLATLDYQKGELVLRRKDAASLATFEAAAKDATVVPFWIASDHFMVGRGRIDALPPALLFVDTGLAGAGVKLAESVIKAAGIVLEEDKAESGAGAGGALRIVPYVVKSLSFGDATQADVPGLFDGPFPWETMFGFHLAGMVGHDFFSRYAVTFDFEGMQIFLE